uniref:interferon-induced protein with tetratricopeptide repeats 1-like n=1 Tax=Myxine glutinosa TaxID=7769 RepID=UPI00358F1056
MVDQSLEAELKQLECHFSWNLEASVREVSWFEEAIEFQLKYNSEVWNPAAHNFLAFIAAMKNSWPCALQHLAAAEEASRKTSHQEMSEHNLVLYSNYAWVHFQMNNQQEANYYLKKVQKISGETKVGDCTSPVNPEVLAEKGWTLFRCGFAHYNNAAMCLKEALKSRPDHVQWTLACAIALWRLEWNYNRYDCCRIKPLEGENLLRRTLELDPENSMASIHLAIRCQAKHQMEEAHLHLGKALHKASNHPTIQKYFGQFLEREGSPESLNEAIRIAQDALNTNPNNRSLLYTLGKVYFKKAELLKRERMEPKTKQAQIKCLLDKSIYFNQQSYAVSEKAFVKPMCDVARTYAEVGMIDRARSLYNDLFADQERLTYSENVQILHAQFGLFLRSQNNVEEAKKHFTLGLHMNDNPNAANICKNALEKLSRPRSWFKNSDGRNP